MGTSFPYWQRPAEPQQERAGQSLTRPGYSALYWRPNQSWPLDVPVYTRAHSSCATAQHGTELTQKLEAEREDCLHLLPKPALLLERVSRATYSPQDSKRMRRQHADEAPHLAQTRKRRCHCWVSSSSATRKLAQAASALGSQERSCQSTNGSESKP